MTRAGKTSGLLGSALVMASLALLVVAERVLGEGSGRSVALVAGAASFFGACVWRIAAWRSAQGDVRAVEARLLTAYLGIAVALGIYGASTDACIDTLKLADDARDHAVFALSLAWPCVLASALSALFFMELVYARMPIAASVELRRVRTAAYAGLTLSLSAVFVVCMGYVATVHDVRRDLSYFKTSQPSPGTASMLNKLDTKVTALLFWRKNDDVLLQVEPYFAALAKQSKNLRYQVMDAALAPELSRKHRVSGNGSVVLLKGEGDQQKGEVMRIGNELIEARKTLKKLDASFQQSFVKLVRPERKLRITVGHGERNSPDADVAHGEGTEVLRSLLKQLNLTMSDIGLSQGLGTAIPDGTSAVLLMGPQDKLLPEEVEALLSYVRKGGRLLVTVDAVDDGLDPLLAGLGLTRKPGTMLSEQDHLPRAHDASDRAIVFSNAYSSHPSVTTASRYRTAVATIFVRGVALDKTAPPAGAPKPSVSFPLRSGPKFFRDVDADFDRDPGEPEEAVNMMAAVTIPAQPGAAATAEGRAVVFGDGDFGTDKLGDNKGNLMVLLDALSWLVGSEELSAESSSEEDVKIRHTREQDKLWFYATTFAVPLPVAGLGLWIARRRRKRAEAGT